MLAKTEPAAGPEKPVEEKRRTITMTNRAPISIIEDNWPTIADGTCGEGEPHQNFDWWIIDFRVRQNKLGHVIIHGRYEYDNVADEHTQIVRVGRMLPPGADIEKALLQVGEEMRQRIAIEKLAKHVVYAIDQCFARMPVQKYSF